MPWCASSRTDLSAAPDDPVPEDVDAIVAALQDDPVLLSAMMGNGATAEIGAALRAKADAAAVPVFVVLTRTPTGARGDDVDEDLVSLVHAGLDRDGVYYVQTSQGSGHLGVYGDLDPAETNDDTLLSLARYTGMTQVYDAVRADGRDTRSVPAVTEAGVVLDLLTERTIPDDDEPVLTDAQVATYTTRPWTSTVYDIDDDPEPMSVGLGALVGVTVAVVLSVLTYRLLRASSAALTGRRHREADRAAQADRARVDAGAAVARLEERLTRVRPTVDAERRELAGRCADTARELLDAPGDDALLDLVGAEVLARTGARALEPRSAPYRCCFVDPRHGAASHDDAVGGGLTVPVCVSCHRALEDGRRPTALTDGRRPYWEGDSVWARTGYGATTETLWADVRRRAAR